MRRPGKRGRTPFTGKRGTAPFSGILLVLAFAAALHAHAAAAQQKLLTLDDIYGSGGGRFNGRAEARLTFLENPWLDDAH